MSGWPPPPPDESADGTELADYVELQCLLHGTSSVRSLLADVGRLAENDYSDGVPEEEGDGDGQRGDVATRTCDELEQRSEYCRGGYPFTISPDGYVLKEAQSSRAAAATVYRYLLLATRLNMQRSRKHDGIEGALLFEDLSAEVARNYMGDRSDCMVFGTAWGGAKFRERVDALCRKMGEGRGFVARDRTFPERGDGKLDVVVWKGFADGKESKLMAFGQCKTGTHWGDSLAQLQPDVFCQTWMSCQPVPTPVRMFFVAEAMTRTTWYQDSVQAGILFDRCRIVDYAEPVCPSVLAKIERWTQAVLSLPVPS